VFGTDPEQYAAGRPGYPPEIFDTLTARCGLVLGTPTLEIGPGAGQATAELLERGADPLTVVDPDPALASYLRRRFGTQIEVANVRFEDFDVPVGAVRLAASATAWHWVEQGAGLRSVAHALARGAKTFSTGSPT
jgi:SAM-dependent methyltransferase